MNQKNNKKNLPVDKNNNSSKNAISEIEKAIEQNPEILEKLTESKTIQEIALHKSESYSGPLPHPDILKKYNEIDPNFAQIIFSHFKDEQTHRHSIDNKAIDGAIKSDKRAQWMAFSLSASVILLSFFCIYSDKEVAGAIGIIAGLGTLIAAYLKSGKNNDKKDN
ncbi:DUF2335 domain-containing protein [Orbaceae bacterium ac157xtp]